MTAQLVRRRTARSARAGDGGAAAARHVHADRCRPSTRRAPGSWSSAPSTTCGRASSARPQLPLRHDADGLTVPRTARGARDGRLHACRARRPCGSRSRRRPASSCATSARRAWPPARSRSSGTAAAAGLAGLRGQLRRARVRDERRRHARTCRSPFAFRRAERVRVVSVTSFLADYGVVAIFVLMFVDAIFPAASELVMLYGGALASGALDPRGRRARLAHLRLRRLPRGRARRGDRVPARRDLRLVRRHPRRPRVPRAARPAPAPAARAARPCRALVRPLGRLGGARRAPDARRPLVHLDPGRAFSRRRSAATTF